MKGRTRWALLAHMALTAKVEGDEHAENVLERYLQQAYETGWKDALKAPELPEDHPWVRTKIVHKHTIDGARFREARHKAGLTLGKLAKMVGTTPSFLCDLEYNRRDPSAETLAKLVDALKEAPP